jgi:hypothetical protein
MASFYETIVHGRLHWVLTYDCLEGQVEAMGWGRSPASWREAVLAQEGTFRLALPDGAGSHRVTVLKALRDGGVPFSQLAAGLDAAVGPSSIAGTRTEMELLAARVRSAAPAVRCVVTPVAAPAGG